MLIIKKTMCHHTLKCVVCWHLFLGPQEFLILDGAQDFTILTCSEIKTPKSNPLTKVSGLISDINKIASSKLYNLLLMLIG